MSTSLNTLDGKWYETARTQNCTENDSDDVFAYISTFSESKISIFLRQYFSETKNPPKENAILKYTT